MVEYNWSEELSDGPPHSLPIAPPQPQRTEEMIAKGQHWIWLAGANPPRWEIRGTGVSFR